MLTTPEHPNRLKTQCQKLQKLPNIVQRDNAAPAHNDKLTNNINACNWQTFRQGNFPIVARATETAGLRCPPETPPLTRIPKRTPSPHLENRIGLVKHYFLHLIWPPVDGEEVSLCSKGQNRLSNRGCSKRHKNKCTFGRNCLTCKV